MYFKLFSSAVIVKGFKESAIFDLEKFCSYPLHNHVYDFIVELNTECIKIVDLSYKYDLEVDCLLTVLQQFVDNKLGFFTENPSFFPSVNRKVFHHYEKNAILEVDNNNFKGFYNMVKKLESLSFKAFEIRIVNNMNVRNIEVVLASLTTSSIRYISLYFNYESVDDVIFADYLLKSFPRLQHIGIFNSYNIESKPRIIHIGKMLVPNMKDLSKVTFIINEMFYTESHSKNASINNKVFIGVNGDIKNNSGHEEVFGSINKCNIEVVLNTDEFKRLSNITNNKIEKCSHCQYKYVCFNTGEIDSELNMKNGCNFNPYENRWGK